MTKIHCGPEQIKPADNFWTIDPQVPVKLKIGKDGVAARQPISVPGLLSKVAREHPNHPALCYKNINNVWQSITYG